MQATHHRPTSKLWILLLLGLALAVALPLTKHARTGHAGQYNAVTISQRYIENRCKPLMVFSCPAQRQFKVICGIKPEQDIYGGLIIGVAGGTKKVLTGFATRKSYWMASLVRDGCFPVAGLP